MGIIGVAVCGYFVLKVRKWREGYLRLFGYLVTGSIGLGSLASILYTYVEEWRPLILMLVHIYINPIVFLIMLGGMLVTIKWYMSSEE